MSLARAFTTRRNKPPPDTMLHLHIGRAASQRMGKPIARDAISGPVALVSTTNMLSYEAPDIAGTAPITVRLATANSVTDSSSGDESDQSTLSIDTKGTVTDLSSIEASPISPDPEPNHLSCYFKPTVGAVPSRSQTSSPSPIMDAPSIPRRVPSHSKKAHEHIHRKRTIQRMMSPPPASLSAHGEAKESSFVGAPKDSPFDNELRELDEVAEGFTQTIRSAEDDAEAAYLNSKNLAHLAASDYLSEIQSLIYTHLAEEPVWI